MANYEIALGTMFLNSMGVEPTELAFNAAMTITFLAMLFGLAGVVWGDFATNRLSARVFSIAAAVIVFSPSYLVMKTIDHQRNHSSPREASPAAPLKIISTPEGRVTLTKTGRHFYAEIRINGVTVRGMIDTGATRLALSRHDAQRIGVDLTSLRYDDEVRTANGSKKVARVNLDRVTLGSIRIDDVAASVDQGEMDETLIGMSFLGRLDEMSIQNDRMALVSLNEMSL